MNGIMNFFIEVVAYMFFSGVSMGLGFFLFQKGFNLNIDRYINGKFEFFVMLLIGAFITYFYGELVFDSLADKQIILLITTGFPSILAIPITAAIFRNYGQ